jgi:hypothetical protein
MSALGGDVGDGTGQTAHRERLRADAPRRGFTADHEAPEEGRDLAALAGEIVVRVQEHKIRRSRITEQALYRLGDLLGIGVGQHLNVEASEIRLTRHPG